MESEINVYDWTEENNFYNQIVERSLDTDSVFEMMDGYAKTKLEEQEANHKNELFRMYLRPFLNKEGLIEPHLVDILIDRYNEEFETEQGGK